MDYCFGLIRKIGLKNFLRSKDLAKTFCEYLFLNGEIRQAADLLVNLESVYPTDREVPLALARVYRQVGDYQNAFKCYQRSGPLHNIKDIEGFAFSAQKLKMYDTALDTYKLAFHKESTQPGLLGRYLLMSATLCRFDDVEELLNLAEDDGTLSSGAIDPFTAAVLIKTPSKQRSAIEAYANKIYGKTARIYNTETPARSGVERWGFVSGEFRNHATSYLIISLLEELTLHGIEVYLYDNGYDDGSDVRHRLSHAAKYIRNIRLLSDAHAADLIHHDQLSALFNLNGYFGGHRTGVFQRRPCLRQINFLGFPATMGAEFISEIIADDTVIPFSDTPYYAESVIRLRGCCYQPHDGRFKSHSEISTARGDHGLREGNFIYGCFNNNYKITRDVIRVWSVILNNTDRSILWLLGDNAVAQANLIVEFERHGVLPSKLVFAQRVDHLFHLERHTYMDLFLDTWPCNAHTTATDAVSEGVPLLTMTGSTFAGRVATSIVSAAGMRDHAVTSEQAYVKFAVSAYAAWEGLRGNLQRASLSREEMKKKFRDLRTPYTEKFVEAVKNPRA